MKNKNQYFIYLFKEIRTGNVIYVGSTKNFTARFNEHRRALRDESRQSPIHKYMNENNIDFCEDVEIVIAYFFDDCDKETVIKKEAEYYDLYKETLKNFRRAEDRENENSRFSTPIKCLTDGNVFASIRQCAEFYGLNRVTLSNKFKKDIFSINGLEFEMINFNGVKPSGQKRVKCVETGIKYNSISECAKEYGFSISNMSKQLKSQGEYKRFGLTFVRCND